MKKQKLFLLTICIILVTAVSAWCDTVDELLKLDSELVKSMQDTSKEAIVAEGRLRVEEIKIFDKLFESKEAMKKLINLGNRFESGLDSRFVARLKFEVNQESRTDLKAYLDDWTATWGDESASMRGKKKIAYIYGNEVNLMDGEWRHAPDGKRFWVSNEYPDVVLTPAEYRRYAQSATVVYD